MMIHGPAEIPEGYPVGKARHLGKRPRYGTRLIKNRAADQRHQRKDNQNAIIPHRGKLLEVTLRPGLDSKVAACFAFLLRRAFRTFLVGRNRFEPANVWGSVLCLIEFDDSLARTLHPG